MKRAKFPKLLYVVRDPSGECWLANENTLSDEDGDVVAIYTFTGTATVHVTNELVPHKPRGKRPR